MFTAPVTQYIDGHSYYAGLDFGQTKDFTALSVFDATTKQQVDLLHIRGLEWAEIRNRIKQTADKWHVQSILAERNSIGSVNIEALQALGLPVQPFETTNESKSSIMSNMNEQIHFGGWKLRDIPEQRHEMNTFVATQLPSGAWRLAADGEGHDDIVICDALGIYSATRNDNWIIS